MATAQNEDGGESADDIDYLHVVDKLTDGHEGALTIDVADEFGYTKQGVIKRLKRLEEDGLVTHSEYQTVWVWHLTDKGEATLEGQS